MNLAGVERVFELEEDNFLTYVSGLGARNQELKLMRVKGIGRKTVEHLAAWSQQNGKRLIDAVPGREEDTDLRDSGWHLGLFEWREEHMLATVARAGWELHRLAASLGRRRRDRRCLEGRAQCILHPPTLAEIPATRNNYLGAPVEPAMTQTAHHHSPMAPRAVLVTPVESRILVP